MKESIEKLKEHSTRSYNLLKFDPRNEIAEKACLEFLKTQIDLVKEALKIIEKQQEIITELKSIIDYNDEVIKYKIKNDEFYYKMYMSDFIETVKNEIKEMEEIDTN
jgi:Tfp pilus assembly protein PilO